MICMCELGETESPLGDEQVQRVEETVISIWSDDVTEHIELSSMFTEEAPYSAIHKHGPIRCSDHRILHDLYTAHEEARIYRCQTDVCLCTRSATNLR